MNKSDIEKLKYEEEAYTRWRMVHCNEIEDYIECPYEPLISIVVPVYNVKSVQLIECIESVLNQTYQNFELILVDDNSSWESVRNDLSKYEDNSKVRIIYRSENGHISKATNDGIFVASGEFLAFMDCDDTIELNALAEMVYYLNDNPDTDFLYSDEDKVTEDGIYYHTPFFKPDWSPDTFLSMMYTNHLALYRREIVCYLGGLRSEFNGSQDYDMTLRFMELSDNKRVGHIPKVLYHWRERRESAASSLDAKPYAVEAAKRALLESLDRRGIEGNLSLITEFHQYRIDYITVGNPLVSIVIPSKDNYSLLTQCINSIYEHTLYSNYEIIVVDNGSEEYNREIISEYLNKRGITYIYEKMEFNFSKMCNIGVSHSKGEYILLLNDDIEVIRGEWLDRMLGHAMQTHVGAVGAKLLFPQNDTIQHIGVCNLPIGPSHMFVGFPDSITANYGRNRLTFNWLAVTGACLMVSKDKYDEVGGLDEKLTVAYNDVDLCFKLFEAGYYNVSRMDAVLYHHESFSRGYDSTSESKMNRLRIERERLYYKHKDLFGIDPFYNVNFAKYLGDYSIDMYGVDTHNYDVKLSKEVYSSIPTDLRLGIDGVGLDDNVRIKGWAFSDDTDEDFNATRYLLLKNKANQIFVVPTERTLREDLKKNLGLDNIAEGFICNIDRKLLVTDFFDYNLGLLQINTNGDEKYIWSDEKVPCDKIEEPTYLFYSRRLKACDINRSGNICYAIDSVRRDTMVSTRCGAYDDMCSIRGWAYIPGGISADNRIEIGIADNNGDIVLYDTIREIRLDLSDASPEESAYLSGFKSEIPRKIGKEDKCFVVLTNMRSNESYMTEILLESKKETDE